MQLDSATERLARSMSLQCGLARTELLRRQERLPGAWRTALNTRQKTAGTLTARLDAMSPLKVLSRGYSVTENTDGRIIRSAEELQPGEIIRIRLSRGAAEATVDHIMEE